MFRSRLGVRSVVALLIFTLVVSAFGFAAAQDNSGSPFLGVGLGATDKGVKVELVQAGSPADKAGIKVGDIISAINDKAVMADTIRDVIGGYKVGDEITISLTRGGDNLDVKAILAARPTTEPQQPSVSTDRPMLGVQLEDTDRGLVIRDVAVGSPAEKAGLKVGDVLTMIGDTAVKDAKSASASVQALKVGDEVSIAVTRDGKTVTVKAILEAAPMMNLLRNNKGIMYNADDKTWTVSALPQDGDLYKSGLREGDTITKFDGTAYDPVGLNGYLSKATAAEITLTVTRDGKEQDIKVPTVTLAHFGIGGFGMHSGEMPFFNMPFDRMDGRSRLGVQFVTLDPSVAKEHNMTETVGALVTKVMPESPAEKAGIKMNDVVTAVNGDKVTAEHTLRDLLATHAPGDSIKLDVVRDGKTSQIDVTLDQMPISSAFPFFGHNGANGFPFDIPTPQPSSSLDSGSAM